MLFSINEWGRLRAVILGTVDGFAPGLSFSRRASPAEITEAEAIAAEGYPKSYLEEVAEDLDGFRVALEAEGVRVLRPSWTEDAVSFTTPNFSGSGFDLYNVRDQQLVVGNTYVSTPPTSRFRYFEQFGLQELLHRHYFDLGFRWVCAPPPKLRGTYLREVPRPKTDLEKLEDDRQRALGNKVPERFRLLDEDEVLFDAANVCRLGKDLLYLVSKSGNRKGGRWLQAILGPDYRVHFTETYRSSHLDSTIVPLREGLVLLNRLRVSSETCPTVLSRWDKISFGDAAPVPAEEINFHERVRVPVARRLAALGVESTLDNLTSPWIGLNLLVIRPGLVMVTNPQPMLQRELARHGVESIAIRMRHAYSMLGGLHCTTLDVERDAD
jgi:glycine amidinotransferase/scyllo-inosamine-4-phosphate amidinotransferase 1